MIRGLYFHHYGEVLGNRVRVKAHWFHGLSPDLFPGPTQRGIPSRSLVPGTPPVDYDESREPRERGISCSHRGWVPRGDAMRSVLPSPTSG
jgi:hypothetical protein